MTDHEPYRKSLHPTGQRLIDSVLSLMGNHQPESITIEMVLKDSRVAHGSLYHHFGNFQSLIDAALVQMFAAQVDASLNLISQLLQSSSGRADFFEKLKRVTRQTQSAQVKSHRFHRARLIVRSQDNPALTEALSEVQQRLTSALADIVRQGQAKGWVSSEVDPKAASVLIQAYTLGKIVDDFVPDPVDEVTWNALIDRLVVRVFGS